MESKICKCTLCGNKTFIIEEKAFLCVECGADYECEAKQFIDAMPIKTVHLHMGSVPLQLVWEEREEIEEAV